MEIKINLYFLVSIKVKNQMDMYYASLRGQNIVKTNKRTQKMLLTKSLVVGKITLISKLTAPY